MDGIAVRAADVALAGPETPVELAPADYTPVDTGDPLPPGRDAVVMRERVEYAGDVARVRAAAGRGRHVRPVGEDVAVGELLVAPGRRLGPVDLALAAAGGHDDLAVRPRPTVTILPTGDELRPAHWELRDGELADTNSIMLDAQAREAGCATRCLPILPDEPARLEAAVRRAARESDLVLVVAGTSAGRHDFAPDVLERCGRIVVRGVAMRPGHPAVLAVVDGTPVMGCPGYPVSAALAFDELARPLLDRIGGAAAAGRTSVSARLATAASSRRGASELLRVALGTVDGRRVAVPLRRGASALSGLAHADGLVTIPSDSDALPAGAPVEVHAPGMQPPTERDLLLAGLPDRALELVLLGCAQRGLTATLCELPPGEALALVAAGGCHAAWIDGRHPLPAGLEDAVARHPVAERDLGVVLAPGNPAAIASADDLGRDDVRAVAAPAAWATAPEHVARVRSDDAAVAAVAGGHADAALAGTRAARAAGLETLPAGRARIALATRPRASRRDPALAALLELLADPELAATLRREGYEVLAGRRAA
jgi:putative molybdopterin biosynthesis protein